MERVGVDDFMAQVLGNLPDVPDGLKERLLKAIATRGNQVEALKQALREQANG
jgi:hypothetical protein